MSMSGMQGRLGGRLFGAIVTQWSLVVSLSDTVVDKYSQLRGMDINGARYES